MVNNNLFKLLPQYSDQEIVKPTGREHCPFYSYLMRVLASAADSSVMQTRFPFQKYATSKPVAASYPPHVDRRLRPLHIMLRSSVHSGRRHVAGPQYSSCSTSTKLDTGANSSSARCEKSDAGRDENGTRLPDAPPCPGIRRAPGSVLAPRPGTRARAAPRNPCSRRAPEPVLEARPWCRRRGPRRAREAQARKNEPTELRRSGRSMPDPSTPNTTRRAVAHEAHRCEALVAKTRQETVTLRRRGRRGKEYTHPHGESPAPRTMSRAEESAHRSERRGTALVANEDRSGRNAARRTRVGKCCSLLSVHWSSRKAGRACAAAESRRARAWCGARSPTITYQQGRLNPSNLVKAAPNATRPSSQTFLRANTTKPGPHAPARDTDRAVGTQVRGAPYYAHLLSDRRSHSHSNPPHRAPRSSVPGASNLSHDTPIPKRARPFALPAADKS